MKNIKYAGSTTLTSKGITFVPNSSVDVSDDVAEYLLKTFSQLFSTPNVKTEAAVSTAKVVEVSAETSVKPIETKAELKSSKK